MKKSILVLAMLLLANNTFASGKVTVEGRADEDRNVRPVVGLAVYQKLFKRLAWNSWSGYGVQDRPVSDDVHWLTLKNEAQLDFGHGFTLSPGLTWQYDFTHENSQNLVTLKLEKVLW
jgi:hypothetical protein